MDFTKSTSIQIELKGILWRQKVIQNGWAEALARLVKSGAQEKDLRSTETVNNFISRSKLCLDQSYSLILMES